MAANDQTEGSTACNDKDGIEQSASDQHRPPTDSHYWISNPSGRNQFPDCPSKESEEFLELLRNYHKVTTRRGEVREMLSREHGIQVSERTISRRWKEMGLKGVRGGEAEMTREEVLQLVTDQLKQVPPERQGRLHFIRSEIALKSGVHLKKKTVREIRDMIERPTTARTARAPNRTHPSSLVFSGSNEAWIYDGYDGLCNYGFAIWGIRDKFSCKWLGLWVLPIDNIADAMAYRWLSVVHKHGGLPEQSSSDFDSENTMIQRLSNALKDSFQTTSDDLAAINLKNVQSIPPEQEWLDLQKDVGSYLPPFWHNAKAIYRESDLLHRRLAHWLFPPLIQRELDQFIDETNDKRFRKHREKSSIPLVSPNVAYLFPERCNGSDCLQKVDTDRIKRMLESDAMQKAKACASDWGIPTAFAKRAEAAMATLGIQQVTLQDVWIVFSALLSFFIDNH